MAGRDGTRGASTSGQGSVWNNWVTGARQLVNRLVFQIDEEQEARMRAYLDETYGAQDGEGRGNRGVMMDSLRPPKQARREVPPPTSLDEEVARRLYDQLTQQENATEAGKSTRRPKTRSQTNSAKSSGAEPRTGDDAWEGEPGDRRDRRRES